MKETRRLRHLETEVKQLEERWRQHLETEVKQLEERWRQHLETEVKQLEERWRPAGLGVAWQNREDNPADARQLSIPGMEEHETELRNLKEELRSVQAKLESADGHDQFWTPFFRKAAHHDG